MLCNVNPMATRPSAVPGAGCESWEENGGGGGWRDGHDGVARVSVWSVKMFGGDSRSCWLVNEAITGKGETESKKF